MLKKYAVKIPKNVTVVYDKNKKTLLFIGPLQTKILNIQLKIKFNKDFNIIQVTKEPFNSISNSLKKQQQMIQGTTVALIKHILIETSYVIYKKLKFVGVGYRAFTVDNFSNSLIMFKLGFSHPVYFKITRHLNFTCLKFTKLFIYGNSLQHVLQTSANIRACKKPEPYKGKGILYDSEKIILKEGKKV